jgi:hypothetical protein
VIETPADFAMLAQSVRSPFFESLRSRGIPHGKLERLHPLSFLSYLTPANLATALPSHWASIVSGFAARRLDATQLINFQDLIQIP